VHVIPDGNVPAVPNVGLVVGGTGILVIDTGLGPRNGEVVGAVVQRLGGQRPVHLVTTHVHPEHDLGAQAFPIGIRMIRSTDQERDIAEFGLGLARTFAARSREMAALLEGADFRAADVTFEREYDLDLGGGVRARLLALGPNHTRGDTAVWIVPDRVLFSGDVAMRAQPPSPARTPACATGSRASTGSMRSGPPWSCRATGRSATLGSSPATAPISRRFATVWQPRSGPAVALTKRWRRSPLPLRTATPTAAGLPARSVRPTPRRPERASVRERLEPGDRDPYRMASAAAQFLAAAPHVAAMGDALWPQREDCGA
jgi:glyoxylase-like metal-dependent hydrolase (beta-lactamase superfamily II)